MDTVARRYTKEFALAMSAYVVILIGSVSLIKILPEGSIFRVPLAIIPIVPVIFVLLAFLRYLKDIDELQQRIQLQAIGLAAGAICLFTFGYGLLENVGFPHFSIFLIFPGMVMIWGLAVSYLSHRYA